MVLKLAPTPHSIMITNAMISYQRQLVCPNDISTSQLVGFSISLPQLPLLDREKTCPTLWGSTPGCPCECLGRSNPTSARVRFANQKAQPSLQKKNHTVIFLHILYGRLSHEEMKWNEESQPQQRILRAARAVQALPCSLGTISFWEKKALDQLDTFIGHMLHQKYILYSVYQKKSQNIIYNLSYLSGFFSLASSLLGGFPMNKPPSGERDIDRKRLSLRVVSN